MRAMGARLAGEGGRLGPCLGPAVGAAGPPPWREDGGLRRSCGRMLLSLLGVFQVATIIWFVSSSNFIEDLL